MKLCKQGQRQPDSCLLSGILTSVQERVSGLTAGSNPSGSPCKERPGRVSAQVMSGQRDVGRALDLQIMSESESVPCGAGQVRSASVCATDERGAETVDQTCSMRKRQTQHVGKNNNNKNR